MDDVEALDCKQHEEAKGRYDSIAFSELKPVARRASREQARPGALAKALEAAVKFSCPEECPEKKLTIRLSHVYGMSCGDAKATLPGGIIQNGYSCWCSCDWDVTIRCVKGTIDEYVPTDSDHPDESAEDQDLDCHEEFVARGNEIAVAMDARKTDSEQAARSGAYEQAEQAIADIDAKINCSQRSCPDRKLTMVIGPVKSSTSALKGKPAGVAIAIATCPWAVRITCYG